MSDQSNNNKPVQIHQGSDNTAPYPVSRLAPGFDLVDLAREIEQADTMINNTAHAKLRVIADTMLKLKDEARKVLEETRQNQQLHRAQCQFRKIPGKIYHLYQKPDGSLYFSMLSPQEWGGKTAQVFQGSYRLEADQSWKAVEELQEDNAAASIERLLDSL
ncbi:DUF2452 domain-containing protein [Pseudomonadota bacterium]